MLATTLSLVIVFLPVSFLSSVTGRLLFEFGITASVAVMISMLVSFSLTPMMCSRMLKPRVQISAPSRLRGGLGSSAQAHRLSHDRAASRRGFYRWIEALLHGLPAAGRCGIAGPWSPCRSP